MNNNSNNQYTFVSNPPSFHHVGFSLGLTFAIMFCYQLAGGLVALFLIGDLTSIYIPYAQGISELLFLLLPTIFFSRYSELSFKTIFRLENKPSLKITAYAIIGIFSFQIFAGGYSALQQSLIPENFLESYKEIFDSIDNMYKSLLGGEGAIDFSRAIIIGAIIPAISEEMLFRGFLQRSLEVKWKAIWAIILSGTIFGIIHFNPISLIPLIMIGIYFGFLAYISRSILLPMLIHFINNTFSIYVIYNTTLNDFDKKSVEIIPSTAAAVCALGFLLTGVIVFIIYKESKEKVNQ